MDCQATSFVSVTQSDPTSATDPIGGFATVTADVSCPAKQLLPQQRQDWPSRCSPARKRLRFGPGT